MWHKLSAAVGYWLLLTTTVVSTQRPTFRARVDLITVDVSVIGGDGSPVADLTANDLVVTVEGRPRKVVSAQFIAAPVAVTHTSAPPVVAPSFSTNVSLEQGRLIVLVVDQANIQMGNAKSVLKTATGFLDQLQPADRVAVVTIPAPGPTVGLTGDRARVRAALGIINGYYNPRAAIHNIAVTEAFAIMDLDADTLRKVAERECPRSNGRGSAGCEFEIQVEASQLVEAARRRTDDSLRSLMDLFTILESVEGSKTVVLISEGLIVEQGGDRDREFAQLAARARVSLYVLRLDIDYNEASEKRPTGAIDAAAQRQGLDRIAGATRGVMMTVVGTGLAIFERMAREISGYYLVAFEPDVRDRDGRLHDIKVTVRRPSVTVRARRQFEVSPDAPPLSGTAALTRALRAPLPLAAVRLQVASYAFHDKDNSKVRVAIAAEVGAAFTAPTDMNVGYALIDSSGNVVEARTGSGTLSPAARGSGALDYRTAFSLPPGDYTLKLAVSDTNGRVGSVDHLIRARLVAVGDLVVSDPVVTDYDEQNQGGIRLPVRALIASGHLQCSMELRTTASAWPTDLSVRVEIAKTATDDPIMMVAAPITISPDPPSHIAHADIDTSTLEAGTYLVRAVVMMGQSPAGTVTRSFEVARRGKGGWSGS